MTPVDGAPRKPLVSILVPVLNEEGNVQRLYDTLLSALAPAMPRYDFEFVFTDNHSTDRTFALLHQLARQDRRVRVYRFARNVGFQKSILSGYLRARGDAVVQVDCDLQDPPSLILRFMEMWEQGYHVVYGVREVRREGWPIRMARGVFYYVVDKLSEYPLPRQAGDFRLVARPVLEAVRGLEDSFPYLRGSIAGLGYNQIGIPYARDVRQSGESKFNLSRLMALAIDGILATSIAPLRLAIYTGVAVSMFGAGATIFYLIAALRQQNQWPSGFATLAILMTVSLGLNSMFLGIIGEYVGRMYVQSKRRPVSLVEFSIEDGTLSNHASAPLADPAAINPASFKQ